MISILVCTYNPEAEIFSKCLSAIKKSLDLIKDFEILIINNNSTNKFYEAIYFTEFKSTVPNVKVIHEYKQGLTPARLRGIMEASGSLLVFMMMIIIFIQII